MRGIYSKIANENHCYYFDVNEIAKPSDFDGLHYDVNSHKLIAKKMVELINKIFQ